MSGTDASQPDAIQADAIQAGTISIAGAGGDDIEAYFARPLGPGPHPGVVVIHHFPGYDPATKEITRRFAAEGYAAVMPNLYHRIAPGAPVDEAAATAREAGGVDDEQLLGDVSGAAAFLRSQDGANGKVGVIGYCSGGRQSFLAGCSLDLQAAVDCYGAFVTKAPPPDRMSKMQPVVHLTPQLACPVLGLFGVEDQNPTPEDVDDLEAALKDAGKTYEFHRYPDTGHGFFGVDRPSYRPVAATDGWTRILDFYGRYLS